MLEIDLQTAQTTQKLASALVSAAGTQALVLLKGPLGAGKTTFAQGAGLALGITETINSPTFTTLNEYHSGRTPLYHLDLYRLHDASAADNSAGLQFIEDELEELLGSPAFILIEWPEVANDSLQARDYLCVELNYKNEILGNALEGEEPGRSARITAHGITSAQVMAKLANVYFS